MLDQDIFTPPKVDVDDDLLSLILMESYIWVVCGLKDKSLIKVRLHAQNVC